MALSIKSSTNLAATVPHEEPKLTTWIRHQGARQNHRHVPKAEGAFKVCQVGFQHFRIRFAHMGPELWDPVCPDGLISLVPFFCNV